MADSTKATAATFVWSVHLGGKALSFGELYASEVDDFEKETGVGFVDFLNGPIRHPMAAEYLLRLIGKRLEVDVPEHVSMNFLFDAYQQVESDLPDTWEDGRPPVGVDGSTDGSRSSAAPTPR